MSQQAFTEFRQLVLQDAALQRQLQQVEDLKEFASLAIALAARHALEITPADLDVALREARRAWLERWI